MSKNILFYSEYCNHCKEVISKLTKFKIIDELIRVCVDDPKISLPNFITAVPTIYLIEKKNIIIEQKLDEWIDQHNPAKVINEIESYVSSSLSDNFSYLDESADTASSFNYTYLDQKETNNINTPTEDTYKKRTLEDLEKERQMDMPKNI